jgi:alanine racemase
MSAPVEAERGASAVERAVARVDLGAVERNCRHLGGLLTGDARLCAVVKADGYGHGQVECARAALAGGASWLAVAAAGEALALREAGLGCPLLVMGALTPAEARTAVESGADVVAWTVELVDELSDLAADAGRPLGIHVKLDTGMGRLGAKDPSRALALCDRIVADDRLELAGTMTHFATADQPGDDYFPAQLGRFRDFAAEVKRRHPGAIAHAANSAAVLREPASHLDMVRCGIAVYGLDPRNADAAARGLEPALELASYVADVKRFDEGQSAGYGRTWSAPRDTWVGVLPIGYGDGVRRALSNNGDVLIGGRRHPLVGTVSMDNVTVDLGPETDVRPGDEAVLIGAQGGERISCEEVARRLQTINYEVTCGLTPRVARRYGGQ